MAGGVFCFSVESLEGDGDGLRLLPSLRYAHSEAYLERLASQHGFEVVAMTTRRCARTRASRSRGSTSSCARSTARGGDRARRGRSAPAPAQPGVVRFANAARAGAP